MSKASMVAQAVGLVPRDVVAVVVVVRARMVVAVALAPPKAAPMAQAARTLWGICCPGAHAVPHSRARPCVASRAAVPVACVAPLVAASQT